MQARTGRLLPRGRSGRWLSARVIDGKSLAPRRVSTGSGRMAGHQDQPRVQDRSFAFSTVHYRSCCLGVREIGSCGVARQQRPPCWRSYPPHRDALVRGVHPDRCDLGVIDSAHADVNVFPGVRGVRATDDFYSPVFSLHITLSAMWSILTSHGYPARWKAVVGLHL